MVAELDPAVAGLDQVVEKVAAIVEGHAAQIVPLTMQQIKGDEDQPLRLVRYGRA